MKALIASFVAVVVIRYLVGSSFASANWKFWLATAGLSILAKPIIVVVGGLLRNIKS